MSSTDPRNLEGTDMEPNAELATLQANCRHAWVAGFMYVSDEDVAGIAAMRHVECENCERTFQPGDEDF